ncbi:hypothetical protein Adt_06258 [Abeliophyllum distichum]|uniref:Uncharacterized protein n=1 Tax=Abeliophyllum distichum TaxID=126358 RepID=A0ABD1V6F3_9LAMI
MSNPILLEDTHMGHGTLLAMEGGSVSYLKRWKWRAGEVVDRSLILDKKRDNYVIGDRKKRTTDLTPYVDAPPKKMKGKNKSLADTSMMNSLDLETMVVPDFRDHRAL